MLRRTLVTTVALALLTAPVMAQTPPSPPQQQWQQGQNAGPGQKQGPAGHQKKARKPQGKKTGPHKPGQHGNKPGQKAAPGNSPQHNGQAKQKPLPPQ